MEYIDEAGSDTLRNRLPSVKMRLAALRHRIARSLLGISPTLLTAALFFSLFFADFLFGADLAIFGVRDPVTEQRILSRYGRLIWGEQLRILSVYVALGLLVGAAAQTLTALWERSGAWPSLRRTDKGWVPDRQWPQRRRVLMTLTLAAAFHLWIMAHGIAHRPQVFAEALYDHGGLRKALMLALTHQIPTPLIDGIALGALSGLLLGPALAPYGRLWLLSFPQRLGRLLRPGGRLSGAPARGALLLLCAALLLSSAGPSSEPEKRAEPEPPPGKTPSVLLIAVDSLRADRVGPWARSIAPHIAALADRGVRFDAAHVTVPRTFPSFVTILTGRYPHHHGIRTMFPSASERSAVGLALPSLLAQRGYRTQVLSDFCGEIFSRIDLGFGDVQVPYFDAKTIIRQRSVVLHRNLLPYIDGQLGRHVFPSLESLAELSDPDLLADRAIGLLKENAREHRPFFMTVFFSSAHFPYAAPAPYYRRFTSPDYRGPFRYHKPPLADVEMKPEDERQVRALYNGAVAAADTAIGRLLHALEREGLHKDTIVVLLADHGENLYDETGRGMGHGDHLEGSHSLRIPLVVYDPTHRFPAHPVPGIVRDLDLAPTLLQLLGVPHKDLGLDGVSLLPLLRGEQKTLNLRAFSETELWFTPAGPGFPAEARLPYPSITATTDIDPSDDIFLAERWRGLVTVAKHRALQTDRWKLIYRPTRSGVHWSLYDLSKDWMETRNVAAQYPAEFSLLQGELLRFLADDPRAVVEGEYVIPR